MSHVKNEGTSLRRKAALAALGASLGVVMVPIAAAGDGSVKPAADGSVKPGAAVQAKDVAVTATPTKAKIVKVPAQFEYEKKPVDATTAKAKNAPATK
jgi:hypothetical protein